MRDCVVLFFHLFSLHPTDMTKAEVVSFLTEGVHGKSYVPPYKRPVGRRHKKKEGIRSFRKDPRFGKKAWIDVQTGRPVSEEEVEFVRRL